MDSCSDKCKERFGYQILNLMSYSGLTENHKLYTEIYNLVADFQTQKIAWYIVSSRKFCKSIARTGCKRF